MSVLFSGALKKSAKSVAVIMAGGSGTRFWPQSRTNLPKQFLPLTGSNRSLIQATSDRLAPLVGEDGVLVVTAAHQSGLVREQLPKAAVLSEPLARNTAACLGFAAVRVLQDVGDVPMICMPADHMVWGAEELLRILQVAAEIAVEDDVVVTLGMKPTTPETGYGYIQRGEPIRHESSSVFRVKRFVEKPNRQTAQAYLESGEYFWNGGMFVWRPTVALAEIARHLPNVSKGLQEIAEVWKSGSGADADARIDSLYRELESISIDFGVMEKSDRVLMMPGDTFRWSDVGSWGSFAELQSGKTDENGNFAEGDVVLVDSQRCFVLGNRGSSGRKLIAGVGVEDLIIVETEDAILVCHRDRTQEVKAVVDELKAKGRTSLI